MRLEKGDKMLLKKSLCMSGAIAITAIELLAISPASAKDPPLVVTAEPLPTRNVSFADLNLASAADARTLHRRVGEAVNEVCQISPGPSQQRFDDLDCSASAWAGARPQIDRAVLRAKEIAATGSSSIAATAITVSAIR